MFGERFWRWYDRGARVDFGRTIITAFLDFRTWLSTAGGGVLSMSTAAYDNWSVTACLFAFVAGASLFALLAASIIILLRVKRDQQPVVDEKDTEANKFANDIPDIRIADDPVAWSLFETKERDKLVPLLEAEKLQAWGRLGNGSPPLTMIPAAQWTTHYLDNRPADSPGRINQTYFRPKAGPYESTYYDVHLNREQLSRGWPGLWDVIPLHEAARLVYEAAEEAGVLHLTTSPTASPETKLTHFKLLFMVDDETELFGIKPPSTISRPIPKADFHHLHPAEGAVSEIHHLFPNDGGAAYVDVTVSRKDLRRIIKKYLTEYVAEAGDMQRR